MCQSHEMFRAVRATAVSCEPNLVLRRGNTDPAYVLLMQQLVLQPVESIRDLAAVVQLFQAPQPR